MPLYNPRTALASLDVTGNATVGGTLGVTGYTTLAGAQTNSDFASLGHISTAVAGGGYRVKEGSNARMGVATLVDGTVTVANTSVTASTRILLTVQSLGTVTVPKAVAVTARVADTSFTITSEDATDTSVVAWLLVEPTP
jgi:hypothetical protein